MNWIIIKIVVVMLLVLANAFFVAVEFALVTVPRARIETLAATGKASAKAVLRALDKLDLMLSTVQFGVTLASLALGAVGESTFAQIFEPLLLNFMPAGVSVIVAHSIAIALALAVITYLHMVLGEYAPKALAIEKAEKISLATARFLELFYRAFRPFIWFINFSGIKLLKLIGVDFRPGHHTIYTEDELRLLVNLSHQSGKLQFDEKTLIHNVFDFSDMTAREIMVPRTEVVGLEKSTRYDDVVEKFKSSGYSRLPVYSDNFDNILGIVHSKDVMHYQDRIDEFDLLKIIRKVLFIPDSARLWEVLQRLRHNQVHFAVVVDEHSGVEGILTLEDLLEEIVGEIQDEHDDSLIDKMSEKSKGVFSLDGGLSVREANRKYNLKLPESETYTTIAGFLISRAGKLLNQGDTVEYNSIVFTVEQVDRRRIVRVMMQMLSDTEMEHAGAVTVRSGEVLE